MTDWLLVILLALLAARNFLHSKETLRELKKLSKARLAGVAVTFIITVAGAASLVYYGGNWMMGLFSNIFLKASVFTLVLFLVFYPVSKLSSHAC